MDKKLHIVPYYPYCSIIVAFLKIFSELDNFCKAIGADRS